MKDIRDIEKAWNMVWPQNQTVPGHTYKDLAVAIIHTEDGDPDLNPGCLRRRDQIPVLKANLQHPWQ